jgi:hypothetical protein
VKHCYNNIIIFLICLITQPVLYTEEIFVSSEPVTTQEEIQTPLFFKFYHLPEYFTPSSSIEYEDILVPYKYVLSPQVKKINLAETMFLFPRKEMNKINLFLGKNNFVSLITNNIYEHKNFKFNLQFSNTKILYFNEDKQFVSFDTNFIYEQIFDSVVFSSKIKTLSNYISKVVNQYYIDVSINKVVFSSIEFSFTPQVIWYNNEDCDKLFLINMFTTNFLIKNFVFLLEGKFYKFDNEENFTTTIKTLLKDIISGNSVSFATSWDKNYNLYYELETSQQTQNFDFVVATKKKFYYEYIENYFINLPYIKINKAETFCFPSVENFSCKCRYKSKNCNISLLFDKYRYTKYPTYVFQDNNVVPLFIDNTEISTIGLETQIFFVDYKIKYLLSEDILFYPKVSSEICVSKDIFKNIYFLIKLLYNSKIKVTTELYTEENFVSQYKIGYKLRDKFNIELFVLQPLNNKYVLQPQIVVEPYIQLGINFQF